MDVIVAQRHRTQQTLCKKHIGALLDPNVSVRRRWCEMQEFNF